MAHRCPKRRPSRPHFQLEALRFWICRRRATRKLVGPEESMGSLSPSSCLLPRLRGEELHPRQVLGSVDAQHLGVGAGRIDLGDAAG